MVRWRWVVAALLVSPASWVCAGEKPKALSDQEIKALVAQLVSPNRGPIIRDTTFRFSKGFDRNKQEKVADAWGKLRHLGPRAFPFLMERWGDDVYCLTVSHGLSGACYNLTVGQVCQRIVCDQLQPYSFWPKVDDDPRGNPKRPSYPLEFLRSKKSAERWWAKNKDKSLYQMQLDALDWVIAEEAKRPRDFTDKERQYLQKIRNKLVKDGKALPPGSHRVEEVEIDPPK
jgi:hypothetical protein